MSEMGPNFSGMKPKVLDHWQLVVLPLFGGTEFDPGSVHDISLVPL